MLGFIWKSVEEGDTVLEKQERTWYELSEDYWIEGKFTYGEKNT
jgi:hypothetical protein